MRLSGPESRAHCRRAGGQPHRLAAAARDLPHADASRHGARRRGAHVLARAPFVHRRGHGGNFVPRQSATSSRHRARGLELGARAARPGEFTQRAFLNDKLSLTQAEGLLDLLYAPTERALASARAMKEGRLGEALEARAGRTGRPAQPSRGEPRFRGGRNRAARSGRNSPTRAGNGAGELSANSSAPRRWAACCRKAR